ncbi:MAG: hypothetical protein ACT4NX_03940 [Deltaproteobacteria bacterium]
MSEQEQSQQQSPMMTSITMAFNMGVSALQQTAPGMSIVEVANQLGEAIYNNLSGAYGGQHQEDHLRANTEFFLKIALMGCIIPDICAYDDSFKNRLFVLIEEKVKRSRQKEAQGPSIIT